jgi:hypothetical protein
MIYHEKQPDRYVGADCSVTIHSNNNGRGDAEAIEKLIREYFKSNDKRTNEKVPK